MINEDIWLLFYLLYLFDVYVQYTTHMLTGPNFRLKQTKHGMDSVCSPIYM